MVRWRVALGECCSVRNDLGTFEYKSLTGLLLGRHRSLIFESSDVRNLFSPLNSSVFRVNIGSDIHDHFKTNTAFRPSP